MLEKSSVHAGFCVLMNVLQVLAGERKRLLLRLKSLQKVGGNEPLIGSTVKKELIRLSLDQQDWQQLQQLVRDRFWV